MRKATALILSICLISLPLPPARADDSDIFGANIQPNVMILIDSSQSMSDSVPTQAYDPSTIYPVLNKCGSPSTSPCVSIVVYRKGSGSTYTFYRNTVAEVPNPPASAQTALNTVGFWSGTISGSNVQLFLGNYLNSQLGACTIAPCTEPKITVAKRVIENVIANTEGVRFGTMKFKSGGGQVISPIGTPVGDVSTPGTLLYGVRNMTQTSVGTMTGEQIRDAGRYYKGQLGFATPIQYECQPNFVIVVSDGLYTGIDPRPEGTNRFIQDHGLSFTGTQNVIVHAVGFGVGASEPADDLAANDVLRQTAQNGGGLFFKTDTSAQLEAALQEFISQIVAATFAFATPVLPTTSATGSSRAYLAAFQSNPSRSFWRGYLKAYQRDSEGRVPVDANGVPLDSALVWEAGQKLALKSAASRTIHTVVGGSLQDFTTNNSNITAATLGVSTSTDRDNLISYIRGIDTYDDDMDTNVSEDRPWKLGDIFHSTPVLVTPPLLPSTDTSYIAFRNSNASRTPILLAGANDGMLHAFRESDGEELWGFIPPDLLPNLKTLANTSADHPFYVDGSPIAADVKIAGAWKTILIFGERRGGKFYHALDITNPSVPSYLWSFTDSKMAETWSEPSLGKVKMDDGSEKFVAIVGGGYDTTHNNATGKAVFVIDLATGAKLWEYHNDGTGNDRQHMNFSFAANSSALDLDHDGFIDRFYIGDVGGQLWKFDLSAPAILSGGQVTNWTGKRLFVSVIGQTNPPAPGEFYAPQAIYVAPAPALDEDKNLWIFFGTGDRNHPNNTSVNRFYGIKDDTTMANGSPLTETNLVNVTSTDAGATQGWYFLAADGEKVLSTADIFNWIVFFTTFTPSTTAACGTGGGAAKLYAVQMLTGYAALDWTMGVKLVATNSSMARAKTVGSGIPSSPIMVISESGASLTTSLVTATTSQQLPSNPVPPPSSMRKILYWREVL
jgi:type IV pilus assembly protein PilY1